MKPSFKYRPGSGFFWHWCDFLRTADQIVKLYVGPYSTLDEAWLARSAQAPGSEVTG